MYGFHRLGGSDLNKIDWDDPNALGTQRASQTQVGGRLSVYARNTTLHVSGLKTVLGTNNPTDTLVVSAGVGWYLPDGLGRKDG